MNIKEGDIIIGKVTGIKPYALFMAFDDEMKGLLHISELSDSYVRDIEKYGTIGDEIKVKVLSIDKDNSFLRVSFKQVPESEKYTSHISSNRGESLKTSEEDFKPLKDALPTWIENTLKKAEGK